MFLFEVIKEFHGIENILEEHSTDLKDIAYLFHFQPATDCELGGDADVC